MDFRFQNTDLSKSVLIPEHWSLVDVSGIEEGGPSHTRARRQQIARSRHDDGFCPYGAEWGTGRAAQQGTGSFIVQISLFACSCYLQYHWKISWIIFCFQYAKKTFSFKHEGMIVRAALTSIGRFIHNCIVCSTMLHTIFFLFHYYYACSSIQFTLAFFQSGFGKIRNWEDPKPFYF